MSNCARLIIISVFFVCITAARSGAQNFINEFVASNATGISDEDGDTEDWIELFNPGSDTLFLQGCGLSDNAGNPQKWTFPDTLLPPGEFMLIWASGKDRKLPGAPLHTNFKIASSGEPLLFSSDSGEVLDSLSPIAVPTDISYGRQVEGEEGFYFFEVPTPEAPNTEQGFASVFWQPVFSQNGGWYGEGFFLSILPQEEGAVAVYTLNGSEPDTLNNPEHTFIWTEPFYIGEDSLPEGEGLSYIRGNIPQGNNTDRWAWFPPYEPPAKAVTVRAKTLSEDGNALPSTSVVHTYFVNFGEAGEDNPYQVPVISLVTDAANLVDGTVPPPGTGIMVPFQGWSQNSTFVDARGVEWERPVHFEYFSSSGTRLTYTNAGVRVHGSISRQFAQKSLRLYFSNGYGDSEAALPVFSNRYPPGKAASWFKRLILRSPAGDYWTTHFKDGFMQDLVSELHIDGQSYAPSVVFINGEYFGLYNIRDRVDRFYVAGRYGLNPDSITVTAGGWGNQGLEEFSGTDAMQFVVSQDLSDSLNYSIASESIDTDNLIDYTLAQVYFANWDWPHNNLRVWTAPGRKWRFIMYDVDLGFNTVHPFPTAPSAAPHVNRLNNIMSRTDYPFVYFMDNAAFKQRFIKRFADCLNTYFEPSYVDGFMDSYAEGIAHLMTENAKRWGMRAGTNAGPFQSEEHVLSTWEGWIDHTKSFAHARPGHQRNHITNVLNAGAQHMLTLHVSDSAAGYIRVNTVDILPETPGVPASPYPWEGVYFANVPVTLTAASFPGYEFTHWSGAAEGTDPQIELDLSAAAEVTAHYEAVPLHEALFYWVADEQIMNNAPLDSVAPAYARDSTEGSLQFLSCLPGYPYTPGHPWWRRASFERRTAPTALNYFPELNDSIPYEGGGYSRSSGAVALPA